MSVSEPGPVLFDHQMESASASVGFDSEDFKMVRASVLSPLGQKHTAWIRIGNPMSMRSKWVE